MANIYSCPQAAFITSDGTGISVIQIDSNGQVIGDPTTIISSAIPIVIVDANGAVAGDATRTYSTPWRIQKAAGSGIYVLVVDSAGVPSDIAIFP